MPESTPPFDPLRISLGGVHSINASAGTGKTYTITTLYLRYLLEGGCSVEHILVTTFTEAATAELKDRIRKRLTGTIELLRDCETEEDAQFRATVKPADRELVMLLSNVSAWTAPHSVRVRERLEDALLSFDQAPIFTIHGFCRQILQQLVFETGSRFNVELIRSEDSLCSDAVHDFVARTWANNDSPIGEWLPLTQSLWKLLGNVGHAALQHPTYESEPDGTGLDELLTSSLLSDFQKLASRLCLVWSKERGDIKSLLGAIQLKGRFNQGTHKPEQIEKSLDFIDSFVKAPSPSMFPFDDKGDLKAEYRRLGQSSLIRGIKGKEKSPPLPEHMAFELIEQLIEFAREISEHRREVQSQLLSQAVTFVRFKVQSHKREHGLMSFGDMLQQVDTALKSPLSEGLIDSLRERFHVALVDEFQDTDPVQFRIFERAFLNAAQACPSAVETQVAAERHQPPMTVVSESSDDVLSDFYGTSSDDDPSDVAASFYDSPPEPELQPTHEAAPDGSMESVATALRAFVMIGDPKQSIYKFRGADLQAYLAATARVPVEQQHEMGTNWRSDRSLVRAVQAVFQSVPDPFLNPSIGLPHVDAHHGDRWTSGAAFSVTLVPQRESSFDSDADSETSGSSKERDRSVKQSFEGVVSQVAKDIVAQLNADVFIPSEKGEGTRLEPGHIAVLCRSGWQLRDIQSALSERGVPAVLFTNESVYETPEAEFVSRVLTAVQKPGSLTRLAAALCTPLVGLQAEDLAGLSEANSELANWAERFRQWRTLWNREGFIVMWRHMLDELHAVSRLARLLTGERQITNYLHLSELLHRRAAEAHLGPDELLRWFDQTRANADETDEESQLRLETDSQAVQLVTIHKSKGLEYPVVYCPALWSVRKPVKPPYVVSNLGAERTALPESVFDFGSELFSQRHDWQLEEDRAEDRRLLYVALTRASHQCHIHWTAAKFGENSAVVQLFLGSVESTATDLELERQLASWVQKLGVERVEFRSPALVRSLPDPGQSQWRQQRTEQLTTRERRRLHLPTLVQTSYSTLTRFASHTHIASEADRDAVATPVDVLEIRSQPDAEQLPLAGMPGGARVGDAVHAILENVLTVGLHSGSTEEEVRQRITQQFQKTQRRLNLESRWHGMLVETLTDTLTQPLNDLVPPTSILQIAAGSRACEVPFLVPLGETLALKQRAADVLVAPASEPATFRVADLAAAFRLAERPIVQRYADRVLRLNSEDIRGYLVGFIDLVFEWQGRWYVLDYKTTNLGPLASDYSSAGLDTAMHDHDYILQYHLYCAAVDRLLTQRVNDFDFGRDFGGVLYLFLRAIRPFDHALAGVYFDRPQVAVISALQAVLRGHAINAEHPKPSEFPAEVGGGSG